MADIYGNINGERQIRDYTVTRREFNPGEVDWLEPVTSATVSTPPDTPANNVRYLILSADSGTVWVGHENEIAHYHTSQWNYYTVNAGAKVWVKDEYRFYTFNTSAWCPGIYFNLAGNGNIGIGNSTPSEMLDVNGNIKLSGYLTDGTNNLDVTDTITDIAKLKYNQALLSFFRASDNSLGPYQLVDQRVDTFTDESGIDTSSSTNEVYDAVNDLYTPLSLWVLELDYMEYSSDGTAQAAYVTSSSAEVVDQQNTSGTVNAPVGDIGGNERREAQGFQLSAQKTVNAIGLYFKNSLGTPTGDITVRIETDNSGDPSGTLADANATKTMSITESQFNKFEFATPFSLNGSTLYWIVIDCDDQSEGDRFNLAQNEAGNPYANGTESVSTDGGATWSADANDDIQFKVYVEETPYIQSYSENTIKNQGSYSLKCVAAETDSLNETLTQSGLSIDLSGYEELKIDVYSSRTGTNLQLQIHDSGGTTSTQNITITDANTWETTTWDISGISDANKDDIDSIIIKVTNADAANTFYVDNFYAVALNKNMTLISNKTIADEVPTTARIIILEEDISEITLNTDLLAYVSRDDSVTFTQITLSEADSALGGGKRLLTGNVNINSQPSDRDMVWKIVTANEKNLEIQAVSLSYD